MKLNVVNLQNEKVKEYSLNKEVFGIEPNDAVLHDAIKKTQASFRQGTHDTKTRDEVRGGGRKPWKQKGTGRARQGSIRAPHWVGGGVVFGPHPRSYFIRMNKKESRLAFKSALAYKVTNNEMIIVDNFNLESNKTKEVLSTLKTLNAVKKILIVVEELNDNVILATRNINNVTLLEVTELGTYDVLRADTMIITESALIKLEEVLV